MHKHLLIETLMRENKNVMSAGVQVYCFDGYPKFALLLDEGESNLTALFDENSNRIYDVLSHGDKDINQSFNNYVNQTIDLVMKLSKQLSKPFRFVRVDFMIYNKKILFEELTFTPYSGFKKSFNQKYNKIFGNLINLGKK